MTTHLPSNASSTPQHVTSSPFRVVPPRPVARPVPAGSQKPAPASAPEPQDPTPSPEKIPPRSHRRFMIGGAIAFGALAVSFIPTPYQVGGDVKLDWRETARQSVHTPIPAVVEQVLVQLGDQVQVGQPIVQLSSRELEREIVDVQEKIAQLARALELSQQEQVRAEATLVQAQAQEQAVREQAKHKIELASQLERGLFPPEVQQLQVERQRFQEQLQEVAMNIERFEELYRAGAVPLLRVEEQQNAYRNVERDLAINAERTELVRRQIQEEATRELGNVNVQSTSVATSITIMEGNRQMTAHREAIAMLEDRLQQLQAQRNALTLVATTTGTVITSDLDLLIGKEVRPENVLLQVAELSQLTANVEIKEDDLDFVQVGASVTFRPRQAKLEAYDARVETILPNVKVDETQQKRVATVRLVIDNPQKRLSPGSSGYAKIFSEWIPLYQRVGREVLKLIPERLL